RLAKRLAVVLTDDRRQDAVFDAIVPKDVAEAWSDDGADAEIDQRESGLFARRAAAEVSVADNHAGVAIGGDVERKAPRCVRAKTKIVEQELGVIVGARLQQKSARHDLVGVDVDVVERDRHAGDDMEWQIHRRPPWEGKVL